MTELVIYEQNGEIRPLVPKVHVDFNVIELPLFSKNKKAQQNKGVKYIISKKNNIVVEVIPVAGMSIPTDFDRKVYFALVQIALEFKNQHNFDAIPTTIYTTFYEIYSKLNVQWFGGKKQEDNGYAGITKRIYDSLSKLSGTKYKLFNCFYNAKKSGIENELYESTFIHSIKIKTKVNATKDGDESLKYINTKAEEIITLELNPFFLDNLLHAKGHLKHDFKELQRLEDDVAFSIYWHCDKNRKWMGEKEFNTDKKMRVTAKILASKIPLSFTAKNMSYSVKRIKEAFEYLKTNKFIFDFEVIRGKTLGDTEYIVMFDWSRYDKEYTLTGRETFGLEDINEVGVEPDLLSESNIDDRPLVEEVRVIDLNINPKIDKKLELASPKFFMPELEELFQEHLNLLTKKTIAIINLSCKENGLLYIRANLEYTKNNYKTNFAKYLQQALEENYAKDILATYQQKAENSQKEAKVIEEKKLKDALIKQEEHVNREKIKHEYFKLNSIEKSSYEKLASSILAKYKEKIITLASLSKIEPLEDLSLSVYAISNKKSYNKIVELYLQKSLGLKLSIY